MSEKDRSSLYPRLPFLIIPVSLSVILALTLHVLDAGQSHVDLKSLTVWCLTVALFPLLCLLCKILPSRHTCLLCSRIARDKLVYPNRHRRRFCRDHLLQEFRREFLKFDGEMVVFYPNLEQKEGPYSYQFRALGDIPKEQWEDTVGTLVTHALTLLSESGSCSKCGQLSSIAYFGPGTFRWQGINTESLEWNIPTLGEVRGEPEILCNRCVVDQIVHSLRDFGGHFGAGIILPYAENGVFFPRISSCSIPPSRTHSSH